MVSIIVFVIILIASFCIFFPPIEIYHAIKSHNKNKALTNGVTYSWPARNILTKYATLPEANRPYANIEYILQALDTKYKIEDVNNHFYHHVWNCCSYSNSSKCRYFEYRKIRNGIDSILNAIEKQEHEMKMVGVSDGLNAASDLLESLKREEALINQVTEELTA